jgi:single-stranded-DNA-specific exonuclease
MARLLRARGISPDNIYDFLNPKLTSLRDPFLIQGMDRAVERLLEARRKNQKICIYADFDLDGTSGLTLMHHGLRALGFTDVQYYQPLRLAEGYGLHTSAVEDLHRAGVEVMITVDVGITAIAAAARARELGIDLIITDHHLSKAELPAAYVIVNPNQPGCSSGLGHLSGAGVAFYLVWALKRALVLNQMAQDSDLNLKELLDCFVIATVADMVPLIHENRVLVKHGLYQLGQTKRAGLRALLRELELEGRPLSSQDVAVRFAPKLNAVSRLEMGVRPVDIFMVQDEGQSRDLIAQVMEQNSMRMNLQVEAEQEALRLLQDWSEKRFVLVISEKFHRGIIGLVATKLSQHYNCPAFVGSRHADGTVVGSARLPNSSPHSLVTALGHASAALNRFGGHTMAAGFEFFDSRVHEVIQGLGNYFSLPAAEQSALVEYDAIATLRDFTPAFMNWLQAVGPFGVQFEAPLFLVRNLRIMTTKPLRGGHYRLRLRDQDSHISIEAMLFAPPPHLIQLIENGLAGVLVNVLAEPQNNYFGGRTSVQLVLRDISLAHDERQAVRPLVRPSDAGRETLS